MTTTHTRTRALSEVYHCLTERRARMTYLAAPTIPATGEFHATRRLP